MLTITLPIRLEINLFLLWKWKYAIYMQNFYEYISSSSSIIHVQKMYIVFFFGNFRCLPFTTSFIWSNLRTTSIGININSLNIDHIWQLLKTALRSSLILPCQFRELHIISVLWFHKYHALLSLWEKQ